MSGTVVDRSFNDIVSTMDLMYQGIVSF